MRYIVKRNQVVEITRFSWNNISVKALHRLLLRSFLVGGWGPLWVISIFHPSRRVVHLWVGYTAAMMLTEARIWNKSPIMKLRCRMLCWWRMECNSLEFLLWKNKEALHFYHCLSHKTPRRIVHTVMPMAYKLRVEWIPLSHLHFCLKKKFRFIQTVSGGINKMPVDLMLLHMQHVSKSLAWICIHSTEAEQLVTKLKLWNETIHQTVQKNNYNYKIQSLIIIKSTLTHQASLPLTWSTDNI